MGLISNATQADYEAHLLALRPPGPAWAPEDDHLGAAAEECARVHNRAVALVDEADPRTTTELLTDWERVAGLPDACTGPLPTLAQRRAALVARLTSIGGQSRAYFIALAASLGYTVTITEYRPYHVNSHVNDPLNSELWTFVWQVNAALNTVRRFTVNAGVNEPLAAWGNELLECVIRRLAPAHTKVLFAYS
jgi:uncharacterized protein YmfQ (DUF2313 family)